MKQLTWFFKLIPLFAIFGMGYWVFAEGGKQGKTIAETPPPMTEPFKVIKISDGDTITVVNTQNKKLKLRFCGIDAPEKSQSLGNNATEYLKKLIQESGSEVMVSEIERDRYGRTVAEIFTLQGDGREKFLNEEMVQAGFAYHYERYSDTCPNKSAIENAEAIARSQKVGVWSGAYQKPWDYRRQRRK
jgi:endonuclease YncB( thermonuclease family)